jgi:transcriptional regulator with XRE-family HTH domain
MLSSEESAWDPAGSTFGGRAPGPTVQRLVLGGQLRRLREERGITLEQAATVIRGSHSKLSRMEHGRVGFKERDVADLLKLYGLTSDEQRAALLSLARESSTQGWWHDYADVMPNWLEPYLGLEAAASVIRTYQTQFVAGLLQTESYAQAVLQAAYPGSSAEEVARKSELRISRQELLNSPHAPRFWAVIDEGAIRRPIGGRDVMREQVRHLLDMTDHPAVTLQVLPFGAGAHPAWGGTFVILRFAEPDLADVVYLEQLTSALYLDKPADVDRYMEVMEQLCLQAEPSGSTTKVLHQILKDI